MKWVETIILSEQASELDSGPDWIDTLHLTLPGTHTKSTQLWTDAQKGRCCAVCHESPYGPGPVIQTLPVQSVICVPEIVRHFPPKPTL